MLLPNSAFFAWLTAHFVFFSSRKEFRPPQDALPGRPSQPLVQSTTQAQAPPQLPSQSQSRPPSQSSNQTASGVASTQPTATPQDCPNGGSWYRFEESFASLNKDEWDVQPVPYPEDERKNVMTEDVMTEDAMAFGAEAADFTVTEALPERVLESVARWAAPVTLSVEIKTSATPGIASALFFGSLDGGDEIDLELCTSGTTPEMRFPIWRPGNAEKARKLSVSWDKSKELTDVLDPSMHRSKALVPDYGYVMDGYDPTAWTAYEIQWTPEMIAWKIAGKERVRFTRNSAMPYCL